MLSPHAQAPIPTGGRASCSGVATVISSLAVERLGNAAPTPAIVETDATESTTKSRRDRGLCARELQWWGYTRSADSNSAELQLNMINVNAECGGSDGRDEL